VVKRVFFIFNPPGFFGLVGSAARLSGSSAKNLESEDSWRFALTRVRMQSC
jgi:hypothetical protein